MQYSSSFLFDVRRRLCVGYWCCTRHSIILSVIIYLCLAHQV